MSKRNIALLAGGFTGEYEVSVNSAQNIKNNLDASKYNVYTVLLPVIVGFTIRPMVKLKLIRMISA